MYTANEKIALDEFAKKFFGLKQQPYQRNMIKLIEYGKTKRLKLIPYRPKETMRLSTGFPDLDKLIEENIDNDKLGTIYGLVKKNRPSMIIIDDIEAPHRHAELNIKVQHECAIVAIKATTL